MIGQNVHFDYSFLNELWLANGDGYLGSFVHYHKIDLIALTAAYKIAGKFNPDIENMKLETLSKTFGLGCQTHDSLDDIRRTRHVFNIYLSFLKEATDGKVVNQKWG